MLPWPEDTAERGIADDARVEDFIWQRFCETKTAAPGAAWDELVANDDRHTRNFIFDGARYWLIDHELALRPLADAVRQMAQAATRQLIINNDRTIYNRTLSANGQSERSPPRIGPVGIWRLPLFGHTWWTGFTHVDRFLI